MKSLFLCLINIVSGMKKFAVILLVTLVLALVVSSCNKETCPAYSKADVEHAGHIS
jgi:hypothetical protein